MAFSGSITDRLIASLTSPLDLSVPIDRLDRLQTDKLANGTGALQASTLFHDERTLAASTAEELDLNDAANALVDAFGTPLQLTAVKVFEVEHVASSAAASGIVVKPSTIGTPWSAAFSGNLTLLPGERVRFVSKTAAGWAVVAATTDAIEIENLGAGVATYRIVIIGH